MNEREHETASERLPLRPQELAALMILARGPLHAYGIAQESERRGTLPLEIGSLYRMLNRMLTDGWIEEAPEAARSAGPGGIRRTYRITGLGRSVAEAEVRRLADVVDEARAQRLLGEESGG